MKISTTLLLTTMAITLGGCEDYFMVHNLKQVEVKKESNTAILALSIKCSIYQTNNFRLVFDRIGPAVPKTFYDQPKFLLKTTCNESNDPPSNYSMVYAKLPAGKYTFSNFQADLMESTTDYNKTVTLRPHVINYLGSITIRSGFNQEYLIRIDDRFNTDERKIFKNLGKRSDLKIINLSHEFNKNPWKK